MLEMAMVLVWDRKEAAKCSLKQTTFCLVSLSHEAY